MRGLRSSYADNARTMREASVIVRENVAAQLLRSLCARPRILCVFHARIMRDSYAVHAQIMRGFPWTFRHAKRRIRFVLGAFACLCVDVRSLLVIHA